MNIRKIFLFKLQVLFRSYYPVLACIRTFPHFLLYCYCYQPVYSSFSFKNIAAPDEREKNELLLTDKEVLRENEWFKLHREAGLLIWRQRSFFFSMLCPHLTCSIYLTQPDTFTHKHTFRTHTPPWRLALAMLLCRYMSVRTVNTQHLTVWSQEGLWCSCCSGAQCDLNPHLSL